MDKYYTPEIEEFHVGFQCEFNFNGKWQKTIMKGVGQEIIKYNSNDIYRVKHLDREDIEGEGFEYTHSNAIDTRDRYLYKDSKDKTYLEKWNCEDGICIVIITIEGITHFKGHIKNLSEFRRILKQIGV